MQERTSGSSAQTMSQKAQVLCAQRSLEDLRAHREMLVNAKELVGKLVSSLPWLVGAVALMTCFFTARAGAVAATVVVGVFGLVIGRFLVAVRVNTLAVAAKDIDACELAIRMKEQSEGGPGADVPEVQVGT